MTGPILTGAGLCDAVPFGSPTEAHPKTMHLMARRPSRPSLPLVAPSEEDRGVYIDRNRGWVRSVMANRRVLAFRVVMADEDIDAVASEMWDELDRVDPLTTGRPTPPLGHLRLVV